MAFVLQPRLITPLQLPEGTILLSASLWTNLKTEITTLPFVSPSNDFQSHLLHFAFDMKGKTSVI